MRQLLAAAAVFSLATPSTMAGESRFSTGPVIQEFGPVADVEVTFDEPSDEIIKHSFDVSKAAKPGELNRTLVSVARFLNMQARAGVAPENIKLAVVVHGSAVRDVSKDSHYKSVNQIENANIKLIQALKEHGVDIIVCGQSAAYYDVANKDLAPGVKMAISAMSAHSLLQRRDYSINPF